MGTWGTGLSSNDTYGDIYDQFNDLYNEGMTIPDITQKLVSENLETINSEDSTNFWFAIANAQWEYKALEQAILSRVEKIVQSDEDLNNWKSLGGTEKDIKARKVVITKFLAKIQIERDKPKKRVKKKLYSSIFKRGDCLTYVMNNGNYGGAFVLKDEQNTEYGLNLIAITKIDQKTKPNLNDFKSSCVYIQRTKYFPKSKNWIEQPQIGFFYGPLYKKDNVQVEVIGNLPVKNDYKGKLHIGFGWTVLLSKIPFDGEYVKTNGVPKTTLRLSIWTEGKFLNWTKEIFK